MNPPSRHFNFSGEQLNNSLKLAGIAAVCVLTLFLIVKTMNEVDGGTLNNVQNVISVSGKADMDVMPDVTTFTWSVEADGKTAEEAQSKSATINNKAIEFVKGKGIKEADIKTTGLNTYPKYTTSYDNCVKEVKVNSISPTIYPPMPPCSGDSVISGYTTSQSVEVKVRDINKNQKIVGELVAGLATTGVRVSTPSNTIDDIDAYKKIVREEAIIKARREAEALAQSLGVKLVRITSFNENGAGGYPYAMDYMSARPAMMEKAAVVPDLPTGTNKVTSEVTITYQIK